MTRALNALLALPLTLLGLHWPSVQARMNNTPKMAPPAKVALADHQTEAWSTCLTSEPIRPATFYRAVIFVRDRFETVVDEASDDGHLIRLVYRIEDDRQV